MNIRCQICKKEIITPRYNQVVCSNECKKINKKQYMNTYRLENKYKIKEQKKQYDKEYYIQNREQILIRIKNSPKKKRKPLNKEQKEKQRIRNKKWRTKNIDIRRIQRTYKYNNDILYKLNHRLSSSMRKALKANKDKSWNDILEYTTADLKIHLEKQFKEGMSWDNYGKVWHIDHIIPMSWFKYNTHLDKEFKKCWELNNLQPLYKEENLIKGNRWTG